MLRDQLRAAGKDGALADAEQEAQRKQDCKAADEAGRHRRQRTQHKPECQRAVGIDAFGEPAREQLPRDVGPVERREEEPDLRGGEAQLVLDQRRRGREISAVDVIDEQRDCEQRHHARANAGARRRQAFDSDGHAATPSPPRSGGEDWGEGVVKRVMRRKKIARLYGAIASAPSRKPIPRSAVRRNGITRYPTRNRPRRRYCHRARRASLQRGSWLRRPISRFSHRCARS